jgi:hypothetical protein
MRQKAWRRNEAREPVHMTHFKKTIFDERPLENGDTMRVSTEYYAGKDLVHVRRWRRGSIGQLYPTEKGATVRIDRVRRLLKALTAISVHAQKIGVLPPRSQSR